MVALALTRCCCFVSCAGFLAVGVVVEVVCVLVGFVGGGVVVCGCGVEVEVCCGGVEVEVCVVVVLE